MGSTLVAQLHRKLKHLAVANYDIAGVINMAYLVMLKMITYLAYIYI